MSSSLYHLTGSVVTNTAMEEDDSKRRQSKTENMKIKGTVVLIKENLEGLMEFSESLMDRLHEMLGRKISLQLISAVNCDSGIIFLSSVIFLQLTFFFFLLR